MGKKEKSDGGAKQDPTMWMVTFSDLLMLLLTFFVMLLTMKAMDTKALQSIFSIFEGGVGVMEFSALSNIKPISDSATPGGIKKGTLSAMKALHNRLDALFTQNQKKGVASLEDMEEILGGTGEGLDLKVMEGLLEMSEDERGVVITLESRIIFATGSAEIRPEMYPLLDTIAKLLEVMTNDVLIMGHTDNVPSRGGRFRSNWELSLYRALNVHRYFVDEKKFPLERLFAGGYGDLRPKFSNETEEGREKNRRVEIVLRKA